MISSRKTESRTTLFEIVLFGCGELSKDAVSKLYRCLDQLAKSISVEGGVMFFILKLLENLAEIFAILFLHSQSNLIVLNASLFSVCSVFLKLTLRMIGEACIGLNFKENTCSY